MTHGCINVSRHCKPTQLMLTMGVDGLYTLFAAAAAGEWRRLTPKVGHGLQLQAQAPFNNRSHLASSRRPAPTLRRRLASGTTLGGNRGWQRMFFERKFYIS